MKKYLILALILILATSLIIGCAPARRVDPDNNNRMDENGNMIPDQNNTIPRNNATAPGDNGTVDEPYGINNNNNNNNNTNDEALSRRIAEIATDIDGVDNATVVITGDTAYVGIDMDKDLENNETN